MAAKRKKAAQAQSDQSKGFIEKAKEIGCDEAADYSEIMRRLAEQKPRQGRTARKKKTA